ncbi:MAG TPA: radical SAM family heme chaperone HemW [Pirellulaceae bacterium]|nr:radical SAM family heme chaperone HemW [Pirellulaceae bacterium]
MSHQLATPTSVYVHVPFCRHRCGYCNFSLEADRDYLIPRYLKALRLEMASRLAPEPCQVETVYIGGGTPSRLTATQLTSLFQTIRERFYWDSSAEVTMEANPADLSAEYAETLQRLGINRVSLGAQSFHPENLAVLERDHSAETIVAAVEHCRSFARSVSLDLIFGVPGELLSTWLDDLQHALSLPIDHLSTYELTFEKGTRFWNRVYHRQWEPVDEDLRAEMYEAAIDAAQAPGWNHYEISSFAAPGKACRHNQTYWSGQPYYGFGPGAASFIHGSRTTNHPGLLAYCRRLETGQSPHSFIETLPPDQAARERLAIGLRMLAGIDERSFLAHTGFMIEQVAERAVAELVAIDLLRRIDTSIQLTRRGVLLYDSVAGRLLTST